MDPKTWLRVPLTDWTPDEDCPADTSFLGTYSIPGLNKEKLQQMALGKIHPVTFMEILESALTTTDWIRPAWIPRKSKVKCQFLAHWRRELAKEYESSESDT